MQALVAARAEEVRAARHGHEAARDDAGHVRRVHPGREGERECRAQLLAELQSEREREDVERLAGEVGLLAGHEVARS